MDKLYKIEKKEELTRYDSKKEDLVTLIRVWATSKGGTYFHIDIPEELLGTDKATELINKKAQALDSL